MTENAWRCHNIKSNSHNLSKVWYTEETLKHVRFYILECSQNVDEVGLFDAVFRHPIVMAKWRINCANPSTYSIRNGVEKPMSNVHECVTIESQKNSSNLSARFPFYFDIIDSYSVRYGSIEDYQNSSCGTLLPVSTIDCRRQKVAESLGTAIIEPCRVFDRTKVPSRDTSRERSAFHRVITKI